MNDPSVELERDDDDQVIGRYLKIPVTEQELKMLEVKYIDVPKGVRQMINARLHVIKTEAVRIKTREIMNTGAALPAVTADDLTEQLIDAKVMPKAAERDRKAREKGNPKGKGKK